MLKRHHLFLPLLLSLSFAVAADPAWSQGRTNVTISWEHLNKQLAEHPNDANLWAMRGQIQSSAFEDTEAIESFTKAIQLDPKMSAAYIGRGYCYLTYQKTELALKDYAKAQSLFNGNTNAKGYLDVELSLARGYKDLKQYDKELPFRIDLAKRLNGGVNLNALAECQVHNKLFKDAEVSFEKSIKAEPGRSEVYRNYGEYWMSVGNYQKAIAEFTLALDLVQKAHAEDLSGNFMIWDLRAKCYDKLNQTALATQDRRHSQMWKEKMFDGTPVRDSRNK